MFVTLVFQYLINNNLNNYSIFFYCFKQKLYLPFFINNLNFILDSSEILKLNKL